MRDGDPLVVSDGAGSWSAARFGPEIELDDPPLLEERPEPAITIAMSVAKGTRTEWAVQKLTELGVDEMLVMFSSRSVVRWDPGRASRHLERLRSVAESAARQSRRSRLPVIGGPVNVSEVAARPGACMAEPSGGPPGLATPLVLIGPEGGWADDELALGLPLVGLAAGVLRTETAAVTAAALLGALRTGYVDGHAE